MSGSHQANWFIFLHALHVSVITLFVVYCSLCLGCPLLHSFSKAAAPDSFILTPPASFSTHLDGLYPVLLASLSSERRSLVPIARPPFFSSHRTSCLIYLCLLLCGDIQLNPGPSTPTTLSFAGLNIRSATTITDHLNKPAVLHDFLLDQSVEILSLTETWLSPDTPSHVLNSITPSNFSILHKPRLSGRGGGLAFVYRSYLKVTEIDTPSHSSFESLCINLTLAAKNVTILAVYRPPSGSMSNFFTEFANLLSDLCSRPSDLLVTGDFNIHVDDLSAPGTQSFLNLLESFDLNQHVNFPTHESGHSLDLLISRSSSSSQLSNIRSYYPALSDHDAVLATLSLPTKDRPLRVTKTIRPIRSINPTSFSSDILSSTLYSSPPTNLTDYLKEFDTVLSTLLDKHAPSRTISCSSRAPKPFITPEIRAAKSKRSHLETMYRRNRTPENQTNFKNQAKIVSQLITTARRDYFRKLVSDSAKQPRKLWSTLNSLLSRSKDQKLPFSIPSSDLPSAFLKFFTDKIIRLRTSIQATTSSTHISPAVPPPPLNCFAPATADEVKNIILSSTDSSCALDILPTRLLKSCIDVLLPPITNLLNLCLCESTFPASFKHATVTPLLKKPSLPQDDLANYRPISNLNFLSKVLERLIFNRILHHLNSFQSISPFQSAYRKFHSTESALLRIQNDLLLAMEKKRVSALVLLDLSAAFDTVDHQILLSRLSLNFGLSGSALSLLTSYLSNRTQSVQAGSDSTPASPVLTGVPQGSVLGPLLFTLYTTPLSYLLTDSDVSFHFYADDTQLYSSFSAPDSPTALAAMSNALDSVYSWLSSNYLSLNPSKTEYLLIGTNQQRSKVTHGTLSFSGYVIQPSTSARNLGVIFDPDLSLSKHISSVCQSSYYAIRLLRQVRSSLDHNSAVLLANSLVSSKLDYCNSLYYGLSQNSLQRLQLLQNSLARAVLPSVKRRDHITPVLRKLHWLPIRQRIDYKICLLTYKTLQSQSPSYLSDLLNFYAPARSLRSSNLHLLAVPRMNSCSGRRSFSFAAPTLWNALPLHVRLASSVSSFRSSLKTFLFPP